MGGSVFSFDASGFTVDYYNGAAGFTSPTWTPDSSDSYTAVDLGTLPATDSPTMPPWALVALALLLLATGSRFLPSLR
jgi:hypothetical protein